jgi:Putative MetA-pathway of phenol degradation
MRRSRALICLALLALLQPALQTCQAQGWSGGVRAATIRFTDSSSVGALSGVIEYRPLGWLELGAAPTLVRSTIGATSASGMGDLPLSLAASNQWRAPWSPELAASVIVTLPTGQAACGLGSGQTGVGMNLAAGFSPAAAVHLSADASRSFSGAITLSALDQPQATWVDLDGNVDLAPRWTLSLSVGGDMGGAADTAAADREIGGGVGYAVGKALNLAVDVTHRLAGLAPRWGVTLSLGTAATALSPLNSLSPLTRQRQVFVSGSGNRGRSGNSRGASGSGGGSTVTGVSSCP